MWIIFAIKGPEKLSCEFASNCVKYIRNMRYNQASEGMAATAQPHSKRLSAGSFRIRTSLNYILSLLSFTYKSLYKRYHILLEV